MDFPERDWKQLRKLHHRALERFCERILGEARIMLQSPGETAHERYLAFYHWLRDRDKELARAFDDLRRSTALNRLLAMRQLGLVTDDDMGVFSAETRERVRFLEQSL